MGLPLYSHFQKVWTNATFRLVTLLPQNSWQQSTLSLGEKYETWTHVKRRCEMKFPPKSDVNLPPLCPIRKCYNFWTSPPLSCVIDHMSEKGAK